MKILDSVGLEHLLNSLKDALGEKLDRVEVPTDAKYTGVKASSKEPNNLNTGDEWHREKEL